MGGDLDLTMGGTLDPGVGTDGETSANRISMNPEKHQPPQHLSAAAPLEPAHPVHAVRFRRRDQSRRAIEPDHGATQALFVMNSPMVDREAKISRTPC